MMVGGGSRGKFLDRREAPPPSREGVPRDPVGLAWAAYKSLDDAAHAEFWRRLELEGDEP